MLIVVLARTGLFSRDYQEWHALLPNQRTLLNAFMWWVEKVEKYDRIAGSMGRDSC